MEHPTTEDTQPPLQPSSMPEGERQRGNQDWNRWLILLLILVVCLGFVFTNLFQAQNARMLSQQTQNSQVQLVHEQQRETILQNYMNKITDLLVHDQLLTKRKVSDPAKVAADALTRQAFSRMDADRKAELMRFIYQTRLVSNDSVVLNLQDVDISNAHMGQIDIRDTYLVGANMSGSDLHGAVLSDAILTFTNLAGANLSKADLHACDLHNTNLTGANLSGANLRDATGLTADQIAKIRSLRGATMPDGTVHR
ncbi:pentapeptide repeat-containing protein [Dictyobacter aurantiacus]|uniref:Pentapeptide repeat-containing protein n=1 Tax=Dictyobacter aurantiacus TaxID=1936993 RepID=A0A401ZE24_9CHLR|nr:pentapeptide repeat-containing protein [Dictyobacter aurantiacus]GCE05105.1 hypothetical protein KDAU_24340 [Dictyobacter aurantiacus]